MKSIKTIIGVSAATLGFITLNGPAAMAGSLANGTAFTLFLECHQRWCRASGEQ